MTFAARPMYFPHVWLRKRPSLRMAPPASRQSVCCPMDDVRPVASSCANLKTLERARPRPSSSIERVRTPTMVDLPLSTFPMTATRTSGGGGSPLATGASLRTSTSAAKPGSAPGAAPRPSTWRGPRSTLDAAPRASASSATILRHSSSCSRVSAAGPCPSGVPSSSTTSRTSSSSGAASSSACCIIVRQSSAPGQAAEPEGTWMLASPCGVKSDAVSEHSPACCASALASILSDGLPSPPSSSSKLMPSTQLAASRPAA
mmetsp:Transcript_28263/g.83677  ORF Transcript_28263/g.83677 Transcript_28263/m.83677 type:complete len:260 (-) Transcript_28263:455-1234(-)